MYLFQAYIITTLSTLCLYGKWNRSNIKSINFLETYYSRHTVIIQAAIHIEVKEEEEESMSIIV